MASSCARAPSQVGGILSSPSQCLDVVFWAAAGVMYAMWSSLSREKDPFTVIPAIPILEEYKDKWPKSRIRKEIFAAESSDLMQVNCVLIFILGNFVLKVTL